MTRGAGTLSTKTAPPPCLRRTLTEVRAAKDRKAAANMKPKPAGSWEQHLEGWRAPQVLVSHTVEQGM